MREMAKVSNSNRDEGSGSVYRDKGSGSVYRDKGSVRDEGSVYRDEGSGSVYRDKGSGSVYRDKGSLQTYVSLLPRRVVEHCIKISKEDGEQLRATAESFDAGVLFADISGFSKLAEKLTKDLGDGAKAAEQLSKHIGESLHKMVACICDYGGDVIKFAGDAVLAIFPSEAFSGSLSKAAYVAAYVGVELTNLNLTAGDVKLSVHCGVGAGGLIGYYVGGESSRWEYVITGEGVDQIGRSEPEAEAGEVVVAKEMFHMMCCGLIESMPKTLRPSSSMKEMSVEYLDSISKDTPLALSHDLPFDAVVLPSGNVRISSFVSACVRGRSSSEISEKDINLSLTTEEPEGAHPDADANVLDAYHGKKFETLLENLRSFIPQAALDSMDAGSNVMGVANFYTITTLFIRITGLAYGSKAFIGKLEDVILCVESILFKYGGNMCRYTVDDKGSGILAAYGIPPQEFDSKEAPTRAVLAAIDIHKMLEIKFQLSSSVGITTGRIFCGVVGGNIRCEFTLHGTRVNMAARLMVAAKRGVLTCRRTHKASKNQVDYDEPIMINVKSFDYPIPVYRAHKKMNEFLPETFERDQTACETELFLDKQLHDRLEKHLRTVASGKSKTGAGLLLIDGEAGFGKSRIIDHVTHFLRNDIPARDRLNIYGVLGKSLSMQKHKKNNTDTYEPWRVVISGILRLQRYGGSINRAAAEISSCFTEDQEMQRRAMSLVFPKTMALDKGEEAQHHEETRAPTHEDVAEAIVTIFRHWQMTLAQLGGGRGVNGGSKKLERLLQESQRPSLRHESSQRSISSLSKGLRRIFTKSREEMHEALTSDDKQATYNAATLHSRTVLIFEDIHAFSSMSINILVKLIGEMGSDRLCFIATVRRYDGSAMGREFATLRTLSTCQTTILELMPWSKDVVERVICSLMQSDSVAPSIVKGIMKKAYAHPFYTLELLGLMKNSGQLLTDAKRCCILANGFCFTDASLPDTVTSLLQSKIKGLGRQDERLRAQIALQIASIIGVHFTGRLLKVIISDDEVAQELGYTRPNEHADLLPETLSLLLSVQYIKKISDDPKDNTTTSVVTGFEGDKDLYRFRSTIIQQAASDMLLYDHRRALHRKIALLLVQGNVLPPESREGIGSSPAQRDAIENSIAQHFYKARKIVSAIRHLSIAGKRSIDHRNYLEAVVSYTAPPHRRVRLLFCRS